MDTNGIGIFYNPGSTSDEYAAARVGDFLTGGTFIAKEKLPVANGASHADRFTQFMTWATDHDLFEPDDIVVIGTRGPVLDGARSGVTIIDDTVIGEINAGRVGTIHICNQAPLFGRQLATILNCDMTGDQSTRDVQAYFVDPVSSVDPEYLEEATITGHPELKIKGYGHYLNMREVLRQHAAKQGISVDQIEAVIVHAGGGISVAAVRRGKIVAINNANEAGPFSDGRPGSLPTMEFADWMWRQFSAGKQLADIQAFLLKKCGFFGLTGVSDFKEALARADEGDTAVQQALAAFFFHIAEEIAKRMITFDAMSLNCPDMILTGGMAHSDEFTKGLAKWLGSDLPKQCHLYPGSFEMESLARQVFQAYLGQVPINTFVPET